LSKEIKNSISDSDLSKIEVIRDAVIFTPTAAQRRAKSKFMVKSDGVLGSPDQSNARLIAQFTGEAGVVKWYSQPGFKEWFFNSEENKERMEYLFSLALDTAENILFDENANAGAKVQLIKLLATLAGKDPSSSEAKLLDDSIQRMNSEQLKEYIQTQAPKVISIE
jgi:hypothetical protein